MLVELKIPAVGESITEAQIGRWLKKPGESVARDEPVVELETDKVTVELPSPVAGVLQKVAKKEGETAQVGEVIGWVEEGAEASAPASVKAPAGDEAAPADAAAKDESKAPQPKAKPAAEPSAEPAGEPATAPTTEPQAEKPRVMPAAGLLLEQHGLTASQVTATGPGGRLLKEDVERHLAASSPQATQEPAAAEKPTTAPPSAVVAVRPGERVEERVPMSPLRKRIAQRLVEAQRVAALLTTFNEIDMTAVIALRTHYRDAFQEKHGVKLGFLSFFVKACVDALRQFPQLNAEVADTDIVYRNYYDIGIAVSTERGLVVPVVQNVERLSYAEIEKAIGDLGARARTGKLKLEELTGGTFTITNGGIFGSLLSTPIVNPPQSGVLGLHAIQDRPIAVDGQVVIRPMMYVALSYDHRVVDGREAVTFLRRIKETIEDPARLLLEA